VAPRKGGFGIEEEPLRQWILKAYHDRRGGGQSDREILDAIRQFLSGPAGGPSVPGQYFFEVKPEKSVWRFVGSLESTVKGLSGMVFAPLLGAMEEKERRRQAAIAPNLSLYVSSIAGPIAVRSKLDETLTCALVAAGLLGLARLGKSEIVGALDKVKKVADGGS
jgi:hypothetical protein